MNPCSGLDQASKNLPGKFLENTVTLEHVWSMFSDGQLQLLETSQVSQMGNWLKANFFWIFSSTLIATPNFRRVNCSYILIWGFVMIAMTALDRRGAPECSDDHPASWHISSTKAFA